MVQTHKQPKTTYIIRWVCRKALDRPHKPLEHVKSDGSCQALMFEYTTLQRCQNQLCRARTTSTASLIYNTYKTGLFDGYDSQGDRKKAGDWSQFAEHSSRGKHYRLSLERLCGQQIRIDIDTPWCIMHKVFHFLRLAPEKSRLYACLYHSQTGV